MAISGENVIPAAGSRQQDSWRGSQQGHSSGNEGCVVQIFTSSSLWKAFPDELLCTRGSAEVQAQPRTSPVSLLPIAPHFPRHFQHIRISRTPPDTCTTSPISHRLQEPFPPPGQIIAPSGSPQFGLLAGRVLLAAGGQFCP